MSSDLNDPSFPIFAGSPPQFGLVCSRLSRDTGIKIDPQRVAHIITGTDESLGSLLNSAVDLDNADNVVRAAHLCGISVDLTLPLRVIEDIVKCWNGSEESIVSGDAVAEWSVVRENLYSLFGSESLEDISREALLQKIIRCAILCGFSGERLIWNTDHGLLYDIENLVSVPAPESSTLKGKTEKLVTDLLRRYKLLEQLPLLTKVTFEASQAREWSSISSSAGVSWIEKHLSERFGEVAVIAKRGSNTSDETLLRSVGSIFIMKVGQTIPQEKSLNGERPAQSEALTNSSIRREVLKMAATKPWKGTKISGSTDIVRRLEAIGDWSFKLSRNRPLHAYSSTFVHNIPACLIKALGVSDGSILDPFGGTGQTVSEVCKSGGEGWSSDSNSIATMVASTKLTFISEELRHSFLTVSEDDLSAAETRFPMDFPRRHEWFHDETFSRLAMINGFISRWGNDSGFLKTAFSAILTQCTERKGRNANYFADNTPLPRGVLSPSFVDPFPIFLRRVAKNVELMELFYSDLRNRKLDPESALESVKAVRQDSLSISTRNEGEWLGKFDAIVTSPPYLCMTDYVLGSRLSYYWLFPERLEIEGAEEIGRRRGRFATARALKDYEVKMDLFANQANLVLKGGGYLALIIGGSTAERFSSTDPIEAVDNSIKRQGFKRIWQKYRNISWHKNGGKQALVSESIVVYQKE